MLLCCNTLAKMKETPAYLSKLDLSLSAILTDTHCLEKRKSSYFDSLNRFLVKTPTFLSLTESPIFFPTISRTSFTIDCAAFPISAIAKFSPVDIPLQLLIARGFNSRKILFELQSKSVIMNGSMMHIDGLIELILQVFCLVKKKQLPSLFLRIFLLFGVEGSCMKFS